MLYSLAMKWVAFIFLLSACTTLSPPEQGAVPEPHEFQRASNPNYLVKITTDVDILPKMDQDLARHYWALNETGDQQGLYTYEVVVTPVTEPLITRAVHEHGLPRDLDWSELNSMRVNLVDALTRQQSCFDVFLKAPTQGGNQGEIDMYRFSHRNVGAKLQRAYPLRRAQRYFSIYDITEMLIHGALPSGPGLRAIRSTAGMGSYMRELVCGGHIDFSLPFEVLFKPRYGKHVPTGVLRWNLPFAE